MAAEAKIPACSLEQLAKELNQLPDYLDHLTICEVEDYDLLLPKVDQKCIHKLTFRWFDRGTVVLISLIEKWVIQKVEIDSFEEYGLGDFNRYYTFAKQWLAGISNLIIPSGMLIETLPVDNSIKKMKITGEDREYFRYPEFGKTVGQFPCLSDLTLYARAEALDCDENIAPILEQNTQLIRLRVFVIEFCDAKNFLSNLAKHPSLTTLDIRADPNIDYVNEWSRVFRENQVLKNLSFCYDGDSSGYRDLTEALQENRILQKIRWEYPQIEVPPADNSIKQYLPEDLPPDYQDFDEDDWEIFEEEMREKYSNYLDKIIETINSRMFAKEKLQEKLRRIILKKDLDYSILPEMVQFSTGLTNH